MEAPTNEAELNDTVVLGRMSFYLGDFYVI